MTYENIHEGIFLKRPNRFIAEVLIDNKEETVHVKNTGRCRELLIPGTKVFLEKSGNSNRKTAYDLIAVEKGERLINMDSQGTNKAFHQWAKEGHFRPNLTLLRPEFTYGHSRFDFYWESDVSRGFVEVKGVTLEENGAVFFPDAPTLRGIKHIESLVSALDEGYEATIFFVIQMSGVSHFSPNDKTHKDFGDALRRAKEKGVKLLAMDCQITPHTMTIHKPIPIIL